MRYLAKNFVDLSDPQKKEVADFLNALDDHDDVHRVYAAVKWAARCGGDRRMDCTAPRRTSACAYLFTGVIERFGIGEKPCGNAR